MSANMAGQTRALPFTGFGTLPFVVIGIVLSAVGWLMTIRRPKHVDA
jgi:LPXTG-motif cell wall-anchored protein